MRVVKQSSNGALYLVFFFLFQISVSLHGNLPKISIITSIFKADFFIAQFLHDITRQSVFNQCELILINANPPFKGCEETVIRQYIKKFPKNIIYKRLEKDPGLYGVWNMAIKMARGKYITNANVDDRLAPDCYEVHAKVLDGNVGVDLVYSSSYMTLVPNETFESNSKFGVINHIEFTPSAIVKRNLPSFNPMWRKSMHEKYGYFDESYKIAADCEMWIRAVSGGSAFKKAKGYHGLFYYNQKGLSLNRKDYGLQMNERKKIKETHKEFFKECGN